MDNSVWTGTLAAFREKACGTDPVPASVAISAVTASLALALLAKVLAIAGKKMDLGALLDSARAESSRLARLADEDIRAFNEYMECKRQGRDQTAAVRKAIEVPMDAALSAVRGLDLCVEAAGVVHGLTLADVGGAAMLLSAAVRAMLLSVDFNVRAMHPDERFSDAIAGERRDLEITALRRADEVARLVEASAPSC
ncbi:MAG TPA: cyclodeaminase/cyclohydrolase family protein [Terriglobales bacterium]|nr:cyclodeaminase/cyclohydrolase family protein [Terriglobales bacterium]